MCIFALRQFEHLAFLTLRDNTALTFIYNSLHRQTQYSFNSNSPESWITTIPANWHILVGIYCDVCASWIHTKDKVKACLHDLIHVIQKWFWVHLTPDEDLLYRQRQLPAVQRRFMWEKRRFTWTSLENPKRSLHVKTKAKKPTNKLIWDGLTNPRFKLFLEIGNRHCVLRAKCIFYSVTVIYSQQERTW